MKARNLYLLMAREVSTDGNDQMNSIVKIIDQFNTTVDSNEAKNLPPGQIVTIPINYGIASAWQLEKRLSSDKDIKVVMTIVTPDGKKIDGPQQHNKVPSGIDRLSINFQAQGLPASVSGRYALNAEILDNSGKSLASASYPYDVVINGLPE